MRLKSIFLIAFFSAAFPALCMAAEDLTGIPADGQTLGDFSNAYLKDPSKWKELLKYNELPGSGPEQVLPEAALMVPSVLLKEEMRPFRVVNSSATVFYRRGNSDWQEAVEGTDIFPGDTVLTGKDSPADFRLYTGTVFKLLPSSTAVFKAEKGVLTCYLGAGGITYWTSRLVSAQVRVEPGKYGASFSAEVRKDSSVLIRVAHGSVIVESGGKKLEVRGGSSCAAKSGSAPEISGKGPRGK